MTSINLILEQIHEALNSAHQILNCPICLEKINNAAELPCGHIFCHLCIEKTNDTNPQNEPCPLCKEPFSRRDIDSAAVEMKEYKEMLQRLTAQLSLDLGFDITSYKSARISTNEAFSPRKKLPGKHDIYTFKEEDSDIKDHNSEKSYKPQRRSSRRNATVNLSESKHSLEPDKDISVVSKPRNSTEDVAVKSNLGGIGKSIMMDQCSEEDLDIFVQKNIKTVTPSNKKILKENVTIDDATNSSKKQNLKLSNRRNDRKEKLESMRILVTEKGTPSLKKPNIYSTRCRKKSIDSTKSDVESIEGDGIHLKASEKVTPSNNKILKEDVTIDDGTNSSKKQNLKLSNRGNDRKEKPESMRILVAENGTPSLKKTNIYSTRSRKKSIASTKSDVESIEGDGIHVKALEKAVKPILGNRKPKISKMEESFTATEQNISIGNLNLSTQKEHLNTISVNQPVNEDSISGICDGLEAKIRYEYMSKVVKNLEDQVKICKQEVVFNESDTKLEKLYSIKKIRTRLSKDKDNELSVNETDKSKLKSINSCKKNTLRSKKEKGNSQEEKEINNKQDLVESSEINKGKNIDCYKENINKKGKRNIQEFYDVEEKCYDSKLKKEISKKNVIENKADKINSKHEEKLDDRSSDRKGKEFNQNKVEVVKERENVDFIGRNESSKGDEETQEEPTEKVVEESSTDTGSKKRKRVDTKALNLNVTDLGSPVPQSPPKKQLCIDAGTQTSPSRLRSLFLEVNKMFTVNDTIEHSLSPVKSFVDKLKNVGESNSTSTVLLENKTTPVIILKGTQNHSTPFPDVKIVDTTDDDDISMQPTQKNPQIAGFQSGAHLEEKTPTMGNLKTPLHMKICTPGTCTGQGFTVISNITTSEKRRINDSKFFNDSTGFPGDSLLENSELSNSIIQNTMQNNENFTELIESTPQTVTKKPKRISRRVLEFYEGDSNSGDMFCTNNEENLDNSPVNKITLTESETCSEYPPTLDPNKEKETVNTEVDQELFSQKSEPGSESSSKENKNPECENNLSLRSGIKPLENVSTKGHILGDKSLLKNSLSQNVLKKPSCSGILSFVNNKLQTPNSNVENSQQSDSIKKAEEIIEDSEDEEDKCMIEATPEKLSQPMIQSLTSTASGESKSCEPKDFCFVTSSLLASQLRCVKILAEVLECRINNSVTHETSHLIMQTCLNGRAKRTLKYLQAIALHKVVVSYTWITSCLEEKALLAVEPYIVCDTYGAPAVFRSLNNCGNNLLKNFAIAIVEPTNELTTPQVEELLDACGAIVIKDPRCFNFVPTNLLRIIITDEEDVQEAAIDWLKKFKAITVCVDWLVSSIAQYNVSPLNGYLQIPLETEVLLRLGFPKELAEEEEEDDVTD